MVFANLKISESFEGEVRVGSIFDAVTRSRLVSGNEPKPLLDLGVSVLDGVIVDTKVETPAGLKRVYVPGHVTYIAR